MDEIEFGKVIESYTYYGGKISGTKKEIEKTVDTSRESFLKDILDATQILTNGEARELLLVIKADNQKIPHRITQRYTISTEKIGRT